MDRYATNLNTGRLISKSTALYRRLKKLGQTAELPAAPAPPAPPPSPAPPAPPPSPEPEPAQAPLREKVIDAATDLIAENKKQFAKLNQQDSDELLKRLLYEKLCIDTTMKASKAPPPSKKKSKKYVVESSSEEETESD